MRKNINTARIEGLVYQHTLELKTSGPNSKNPGTEFISGNLDIATDDALTNIVTVHFTYVTATTANGKANASFPILKDIIDGKLRNVMEHGADVAAKVRIDSNIGLNEWYSDRNGATELVSVKRNEGGFVHLTSQLSPEKQRNEFRCDMVITNVRHVEADEEHNVQEHAVIKGCIFDYRNAILPVEFVTYMDKAMAYFEGLDASNKNPVYTQVIGKQIATTTTRKTVIETAFGDDEVREYTNTRREYVVTSAIKEIYDWDTEETITAAEMNKAISDRETYLATVKKRQDEYNASRNAAAASTTSAATTTAKSSGFNF